MKVDIALHMVLANAEKHRDRRTRAKATRAVTTRAIAPKTKIIKPPLGLVAKMAQYGFKLETIEVVVLDSKKKKAPEWKVRVAKCSGRPFVITVHAYSMGQARQVARMIKGVRVISAW